MLRVLRRLDDAKLVKQIGGEYPGWLPGCDPDRISIEEVIEHIEGQRTVPDFAPDDDERAAVAALFAKLVECTRVALERTSIGQMTRELYSPRGAPSRIEDRATR
jgi:DNA-binding IscR family transcriptional regulator